MRVHFIQMSTRLPRGSAKLSGWAHQIKPNYDGGFCQVYFIVLQHQAPTSLQWFIRTARSPCKLIVVQLKMELNMNLVYEV